MNHIDLNNATPSSLEEHRDGLSIATPAHRKRALPSLFGTARVEPIDATKWPAKQKRYYLQ